MRPSTHRGRGGRGKAPRSRHTCACVCAHAASRASLRARWGALPADAPLRPCTCVGGPTTGALTRVCSRARPVRAGTRAMASNRTGESYRRATQLPMVSINEASAAMQGHGIEVTARPAGPRTRPHGRAASRRIGALTPPLPPVRIRCCAPPRKLPRKRTRAMGGLRRRERRQVRHCLSLRGCLSRAR